jgi:hypothetical protein
MLSPGTLKSAANSLGLDARPEGSALNIKLRYPLTLRVWLEDGQVRSSARWGRRGWSSGWFHRGLTFLQVGAIGAYLWTHPPHRGADVAFFLLLLAGLLLLGDQIVSEVLIARTRQSLLTRAWELDGASGGSEDGP